MNLSTRFSFTMPSEAAKKARTWEMKYLGERRMGEGRRWRKGDKKLQGGMNYWYSCTSHAI